MTTEEKLRKNGWSDIEVAKWKKLIRKLDEVYKGGSILALEGKTDLEKDLENAADTAGGTLYKREKT